MPEVYHTEPVDLLLTVLARHLAEWCGDQSRPLELQQNARDTSNEKLDLSQTVGWCATGFPLRLTVDPAKTYTETLKAVKETLHQVHSRGAHYSLVRHLHAQTADQQRLLPGPEIRVGYWGQIGSRLPSEASWHMSSADIGSQQSPTAQRPYPLEIDAFVEDDALVIEWRYSMALHQHATIDRLAQELIEGLRTIGEQSELGSPDLFTPPGLPAFRLESGRFEPVLE